MPSEEKQKNLAEIKATSIEFKISEISMRKYFENDYREEGLLKKDLNKGRHKIGVAYEIDPDKNSVVIHLKINYIVNDIEVYGIHSVHKYIIKNFKKKIPQENEQFSFPDPVIGNFLSIAMGSTRGMIVAANKNPAYTDYFLPLLEIPKIIKQLKSKPTKQS